MKLRHVIIGSLAAALAALPVLAETIAFTGAKIWTGGADGRLENATLIIEDGEIAAVGTGVRVPSGAKVINAQGKWLTPGIISPFSRVGIVEVGAEDDTNDTSAGSSKFTAALDASLSFNPNATTIDITRIEGVTRLVVVPQAGSSVFAGQGFVADTSGQLKGSITRPQALQFVVMGEGGARRAGGSRSAAWKFLNGALLDARTFPRRYVAHELGDSVSRVDAEALRDMVRGDQVMLISVQRASDILEVIRFKKENDRLNIVLVGADEGWMVADDLADAQIPVIVDPFQNLPVSFEQLGATAHNAARLIKAGVKTAFAHLGDDGHQARLVLQSAGNAVANGVKHDDALAAITSVPAEIFGLTSLGTLEKGKTADVVLWDGDPLELMSAPEAIYIAGVEQSMTSRQTELRDRYLTIRTAKMPLAYETRP